MSDFLITKDSAPTVPKKTLDAFRDGIELLNAAGENMKEAGRIFAQIPVKEWVRLLDELPSPWRRTLENVRLVGEEKMIPALATASSEAAHRLRTLPIKEQSRLWHEPVEMFAPGRIGRHAKYLRYATEMTPEEVKRSFVKEGNVWRVRNYEEQRAWEAKQSANEPDVVTPGIDRPGRWAIRNGKVYLAKAKVDAGLTRRDVEGILKDLAEEG